MGISDRTIIIDPISRIEGHLSIKVNESNGLVTEAFSVGEMFRGYENILRGRHPMDAQHITERICGVCPVSHGLASVLAQDMAYGIRPPANGRILRNLIDCASFVQDHILHFYALSALDYVDIAAIVQYSGDDPVMKKMKEWAKSQLNSNIFFPGAPFLPRYEGDYLSDLGLNLGAIKNYVESLNIRTLGQKACANFAGKLPHPTAIVAGGVTQNINIKNIFFYKDAMEKILVFIKEKYIPDVLEVAKKFTDYFRYGKSPNNFLVFGAMQQSEDPEDLFFPRGVMIQGKFENFNPSLICEDTEYSRFSSPSGLSPYEGVTTPEPHKRGAYTWVKAPRYKGEPMEVGPAARMIVSYKKGVPEVRKMLDPIFASLKLSVDDLNSCMGRHLSRALESQMVTEKSLVWLSQLKLDQPVHRDFTLPKEGRGFGLTEAPRGALGHWLVIKNGVVDNYQCVVPTTWNFSARDRQGTPGPMEQALVGTPLRDKNNPIEVARVVRSYDPCLACAVH